MTDLVPLPDAVRALPAPSLIGDALKQELRSRVDAERASRGDVHQPEDTYSLVRALGGAKELLAEYATQFSQAASLAKAELDNELYAAVGDQDGVPQGKLIVPDGDIEVRLSPDHGNSHDIDIEAVLPVVITDIIAATRDSEPAQEPDEPYDVYLARYELWMYQVIMAAVRQVIDLGSYAMQVSKVKVYAAELAARGLDSQSGVVTSAIRTTRRYRGIKYERKERKHA